MDLWFLTRWNSFGGGLLLANRGNAASSLPGADLGDASEFQISSLVDLFLFLIGKRWSAIENEKRAGVTS